MTAVSRGIVRRLSHCRRTYASLVSTLTHCIGNTHSHSLPHTTRAQAQALARSAPPLAVSATEDVLFRRAAARPPPPPLLTLHGQAGGPGTAAAAAAAGAAAPSAAAAAAAATGGSGSSSGVGVGPLLGPLDLADVVWGSAVNGFRSNGGAELRELYLRVRMR